MTGTKKYFLGANSMNGFFSVYDDFTDPDRGDYLFIIKGGPGCGKSSFMKRLGAAAAEKGLDVEYALCSGDPCSVDGLYLPALKTAFVDGTAPHVTEARLPGADSMYLDLSQFYDRYALFSLRERLAAKKAENTMCYSRAYSLLSAAGALRRTVALAPKTDSEIRRAVEAADRLTKTELLGNGASGRVVRRFFSAITCQGIITLGSTVNSLCGSWYVLDNDRFLADGLLKQLLSAAEKAGYNAVACPSPLDPESLEAVLLPELSLGFAASDSPLAEYCNGEYVSLSDGAQYSPRLILASELTEQAITELRSAKSAHDELEALYNPHVDFEGVYGLCRSYCHYLGLY